MVATSFGRVWFNAVQAECISGSLPPTGRMAIVGEPIGEETRQIDAATREAGDFECSCRLKQPTEHAT
eukprot:4644168-Amphidinium_carterae.1